MVAPVPFSIPPIKVQIAAVRKVDRKPNPRNEEKDNEKNRQAQREKDRLSQSTSVGQNGKKVDLLLQLLNQAAKVELSFFSVLQWTTLVAEPPHIFDNLGTVEIDPTAFFKHRVNGIKAFNFALGVVFGFSYLVHLQFYKLIRSSSPKEIHSRP